MVARKGAVVISFKVDKATQAKLDKDMANFPDKVYEKVVRGAVTFAIKPLLKSMKAKVPVVFGQLKRSLKIKQKNYKRQGIVFALVGPDAAVKDPVTGARPVKYAHLVEFGTAPHEVNAKRGKVLTLLVGPVTKIEHPGARAKPFMRPALAENKNKILSNYIKKMKFGINKEAKKLKGL